MTTINDANWAFLAEQTGMSAPFNDMYFHYLRSLGYVGTLQDMIAASGFGMNPSGLKNPITNAGGGVVYWPSAGHAILAQDKIGVSMLGDSITAGSLSYPKASDLWVPQRLSRLLDEAGRTTVTGAELYTGTEVLSSGASASSGTYTLTAGADNNPRFTRNDNTALGAGKMFKASLELDNTNCASEHLAGRVLIYDASNTYRGDAVNFGGPNEATQGYVARSALVSSDYLASLSGAPANLRAGGEIVATAASGTGLARSVSLKEATRGVAVHNQGVSGDTAADGLARIAEVTAWSPDMCFVAFGTNDIRNGVSLPSFLGTLGSIVAALSGVSTFSVLATLPPLASDQTNYDQVTTWNTAIKSKAVELGCGWWDRWAVLGNGDLSYIADGRHPTAAGYAKLASSLVPSFR